MKIVTAIGFFLVLFSLSSRAVNASLVVVQDTGEVTFNVLSEETGVALEIPKRTQMEITDAPGNGSVTNAKISLSKAGEKISLVVFANDQIKEMDVTELKEDLVEIEERPDVKRVKVGVRDGKFILVQRGLVATTNYPVNIDSEKAVISVSTESGDRNLSILPYEAAESFLRTKLISWVVRDQEMAIVEEKNELAYVIAGLKEIVIFNFPVYSIAVTTKISATTGEVLSVVEPDWLKFLDVIFS